MVCEDAEAVALTSNNKPGGANKGALKVKLSTVASDRELHGNQKIEQAKSKPVVRAISTGNGMRS